MNTAYRSILAVVALTFSNVSTATAQGQDYTYVTNNGTITITGYIGPGGNVSIPSTINGLPVTIIGNGAFQDHYYDLTSVTIPDSVTNIGDRAFSWCFSLTNVTIGNSVASIGAEAFNYCYGLTNLTIGDSVTSIGAGAFYGCSRLTNVTIGNRVTSIGDWAFYGCGGLTNVAMGNSVVIIEEEAFRHCMQLTSITIPNSVTSIGNGAFEQCTSLESVYFEGNAPEAGAPFAGADNVTVYYLPGTVGWGDIYANRPTAPWALPYPVILTTSPNFGVQNNAFGFRISWATNVPVVVEASTTLADPAWSPVSTNTLTDGWYDFSDAERTNYPARFYRTRPP